MVADSSFSEAYVDDEGRESAMLSLTGTELCARLLGDEERARFTSPVQAMVEYERRAAELRSLGLRLRLPAHDPRLATLAADPEACAPYLALAEELEGEGDPLGRWIKVQHEIARIEARGDRVSTKLRDEYHDLERRGGRPDDPNQCVGLSYRLGFAVSAMTVWDPNYFDGDDGVKWDEANLNALTRHVLRRVLEHPCGMMLEEIDFHDGGQELLDLLLERTSCGAFLGPARLRSLSLSADQAPRDELEEAFPALRSFSCGALAAAATAQRSWPHIESLRFRMHDRGGVPRRRWELADFAPLFDGERTPALRHLAITGTDELLAAFFEAIASSKLVRQLETLSLPAEHHTTDEAIATLARLRRKLGRLRSLNLSGHLVSSRSRARVKDWPAVSFTDYLPNSLDRGRAVFPPVLRAAGCRC